MSKENIVITILSVIAAALIVNAAFMAFSEQKSVPLDAYDSKYVSDCMMETPGIRLHDCIQNMLDSRDGGRFEDYSFEEYGFSDR